MAAKKQNQKVSKPNPIKSLLAIVKRPFKWFFKLSKRGKVIVLLVIVAVVFFRYKSIKNSAIEIEVASARKGNLTETVSASGEVTADEAAQLSFQTMGEVKNVNVQAGDIVSKGDILAQLDTTDLYAALQQADASLRAAQAALNYTYDTIQGHKNDESFSQINTRTAAETTKDKAYWAYVAAKNNYNGAFIKTPFNGIVTVVPTAIQTGSYISIPSQAIFGVVNPDTIYFSADIDEIDIPKIKVGQMVYLQLDSFPDEKFEGKLTKVEYASVTTSTGGTAYKVRVTMPQNDALKFRIGMNGNVQIVTKTVHDVLLVPITAVVESSGETYVWTVSPNETANKQVVKTGASSIDDTEIVSGLSAGDKVVAQPSTSIKEGSRLKIK